MASTKRVSDESDEDELKNKEFHDPLLQQEDNVKRVKLFPLSDTTLQDLPIEILEHILVKAITMEVKGLKFARSVWKEKADPVINKLRTVCSKWNSILTTDFFRNELNRTLDSTAQATIRLDILHQSPMQFDIFKMTSLKDEIFMLCNPHGQTWTFNVHDRNNIAEVKDVILLPEGRPLDLTACNVSNCVYIAIDNYNNYSQSLFFRITKDERNQYDIAPWFIDHKPPIEIFRVSASAIGNLVVFPARGGRASAAKSIYVYNANGSLDHGIMLSPDVGDFGYVSDVMQKSNGNLVMASCAGSESALQLFEIDMTGKVVRKYKSSLSWLSCVNFADSHDRILVTDENNEMELLDSEFNLLDFSSLQKAEIQLDDLDFLHYNSERNEVICLSDSTSMHGLLTVFRFTEE